MAFESCSSVTMITTSSSVNVVNETILAKPEIRQPSNPLLLELMPVHIFCMLKKKKLIDNRLKVQFINVKLNTNIP